MRITSKALFLWLVLILVLPAHATTILVIYSPEAVFIAVDSKVTSTDGKISRSDCKIHISENYIWGTAGLLSETNGPFNMDKLIPKVMGSGPVTTAALDEMEKQVKSSFNSLIPTLVAQGFNLDNAQINVVIIDKKRLGKFSEIQVTKSRFERKDCPSASCAEMGFFAFGEHGKVDSLITEQLLREMLTAPAKTLNYLISQQERATPQFVGGKIAILVFDNTGTHWLQDGECDQDRPKPSPSAPPK